MWAGLKEAIAFPARVPRRRCNGRAGSKQVVKAKDRVSRNLEVLFWSAADEDPAI